MANGITAYFNQIETTLEIISEEDGKRLSIAATEDASLVTMTIYNNPEQEKPSADIKIPSEQMASFLKKIIGPQFLEKIIPR